METGTRKIHFIGIGGIGMSALAQLLSEQGVAVTGSDREASAVTELLEKKGITVTIGHKDENVPENAEVAIYSDAVPIENPERARSRALGIKQLSYFEMLGEVSKDKMTIAVSGTHGKTTTTGMLARILRDAGARPTAVIGSLVKDFGSNYLPAGKAGLRGDSDLFVVEACEYRDHLLELAPRVLVVTNLEWDHTDWFPSLEALQDTFRKAIERVPRDGVVVTNPHDPNIAPMLRPNFANGYEWAQQGYAGQARIVDYTKEPSYKLRLPGEFNQMNARAAAAAARAVLQTISDETIANSLAAFQGTWRRFEYKGKTARGADVYDDYAHHPTAVRETLRALRAQTKGTVIVAFHPHLYSRTRDLLDGFALAFGDADRALIAPIYSARETDDGSISSELLAERIRATGADAVALDSFGTIEQALGEAGPGDTIITMGAGDIYKVADTLVKNIGTIKPKMN